VPEPLRTSLDPLTVAGPETTLKLTGNPELETAVSAIGVVPKDMGLATGAKVMVCVAEVANAGITEETKMMDHRMKVRPQERLKRNFVCINNTPLNRRHNAKRLMKVRSELKRQKAICHLVMHTPHMRKIDFS